MLRCISIFDKETNRYLYHLNYRDCGKDVVITAIDMKTGRKFTIDTAIAFWYDWYGSNCHLINGVCDIYVYTDIMYELDKRLEYIGDYDLIDCKPILRFSDNISGSGVTLTANSKICKCFNWHCDNMPYYTLAQIMCYGLSGSIVPSFYRSEDWTEFHVCVLSPDGGETLSFRVTGTNGWDVLLSKAAMLGVSL